MRDICIPVPDAYPNKRTEFEILFEGNDVERYRIECFPITQADDKYNNHASRASLLKNAIAAYDYSWELIQILDTRESTDYVYILYRKKHQTT